MKKNWIVVILFIFHLPLWAIKSYYYYVSFYDTEAKPYVEMYITFIGKSLQYQRTDVGYKGCIQLTIVYKQEGIIKHFDKLFIDAPLINDSTEKKDFVYVHRMFVEPGIYNLELIVNDTLNKNSDGENRFYDVVQIFPLNDDITCSGIQFIEKAVPTEKETMFSKSGYDLYPYMTDYFPSNVNKIQAYIELYNTQKKLSDEEFLAKAYIQKIYASNPYEQFVQIKRLKPRAIVPFIFGFDITSLPSGNYYLTVELINKNNQVLASQKVFFQRSNPSFDRSKLVVEEDEIKTSFIGRYHNIDTLKDFILCLFPIANNIEWDRALQTIQSKDVAQMKRFILEFWKTRNVLNPEEEWNKYKVLVDYVNRLYSTQVKKGYDSDRGRVYLKYGAPNNIIESKHEPSAYPYEIWHYYVIGNQRDRRFVFYNPTLVGNDYILLHSDVRGEIYDKNWERRLSSRNNSMYNFNATESDDQYGSRARENFRNK
ncbi:MAG: GWxTD domain-containing protein [Bacteroidales bacterium]|nr:GWxTD domain-containing protein [Bacteroidales bacterium]